MLAFHNLNLISVDEAGAGDPGQDALRGPHEALLLRTVRRGRRPGKRDSLYRMYVRDYPYLLKM